MVSIVSITQPLLLASKSLPDCTQMCAQVKQLSYLQQASPVLKLQQQLGSGLTCKQLTLAMLLQQLRMCASC